MADRNEPVLLELAHLPREQIGPFLLLGLDKEASKEDIESHWADRIKWARKQQTTLTLEEINWARELLNDTARRLAADAVSLNVDLADGTLSALMLRHGPRPFGVLPGWEPIDEEKQLAGVTMNVEVPDLETVRTSIAVPELPRRCPAAQAILTRIAGETLDPWSVRL